ncbi:MAG: histidine phosphatase family protein [Bacteroidetes bacterium]|nr:histidine phosphatase family protein [Bacteroidota bacterium]
MTTKKTIYLIRHGETDYNKNGIIQGSGINSNLNENGLLQAKLFHLAYRHIKFDKIYISELNRTYQSVFPFINDGFEYEKMHELNEINWGMMEGAMPTKVNQIHYNQMIEDWKSGFLDKCVENGESPAKLANRQKAGFEKIMKKHNENTILICMHGRALRSFLCLMLKLPLSKMEDFKHSNFCLYILKQKTETEFEILLENSIEHLW